jgi:diguanylate cyclase (GGDEF)-like protein
MKAALMRHLPAALMRGKELDAARLWRLVDTLYLQPRSLIEGSLACGVVLVTCAFWSGMRVFGVLAVLMLLLLAARLFQAHAYKRRSDRHSAQLWARWFSYGAAGMGAAWGATLWLALTRIHDPAIHMVVMTVQAGWVAGASIRNAASPAAVSAQALMCLIPGVLGALANGTPVYRLSAIFFVVMATSIRSVVIFLGRQMTTSLLSEQRLAEVNAQLTGTCAALEQANARLKQLSATDALTGIGNRRAFDAALATEWGHAMRDGSTISLLFIDVDLFKAFNDFYGHPAGDACLRIIADTIEQGVRRPLDFVGRFGGEEFVALLPGVDSAGALDMAEKLRGAVIAGPVPHARSPFGVVTVSVGAATAAPLPGSTALDLLGAADRALYLAKRAGRNRTEASILPSAQSTADADMRPILARSTAQ